MKSRVVTRDIYHEYHVRNAITEIQNNGYEVIAVRRLGRRLLGIFGEDITEITYK